jgi:hypothetical protein
MDSKNKCPICLESIEGDSIKQKCCSNYFHSVCLKKWYKSNSKCPLCRSEPQIITFKEYLEIRDYFKKFRGSEYIDVINNYLKVFYYTSKNKKEVIYNFLLFFTFLNHMMTI